MSLTHHRVLVIGGSSGMGRATARAAVDAGAEVVITATSAERLAAALAELPAACAGHVADLREESSVAALLDRVGTLDHLVITAGDAVAPSPLTTTPLADLRALLEVRFWGAITAVQQAATQLSAGGSITLTSGTIGVRPMPGSAVAAAGASAIEGLTRGLAVELAPIRVNAVRPGVVRTPMWDGLPEEQREAMFTMLAGRTLTGSIGTAEQVAAAHLHLMENEFITGSVVTLDGGALLV